MKRSLRSLGVFIVSALLLGIASTSFAQNKFKFGNVPDEDLKMTAYPADTSAVAAVIYEDCNVWYTVTNDFAIVKEYTVRFKILKNGGLDYADFSIPFRYGESNDWREIVSGISGNVFNIDENGKTERTKLSKEYITEEKTTESYRRKKIAFPNVKVGSVVELKYQITSPYFSYIDDYVFQRSIPVRYSRFTITIPEYFIFTKNSTGYENIKYTEKNENLTLMLGAGRSLSCTAKKMIFECSELPAMKKDDYILSRYDFLSKVTFDCAGLQIPGAVYRNFATKWEDIDKRLIENSDFGKQFNHSNLLKDELAALLKPEMNDNQKITAILNLVKEKIKWDSKDALWVSNLKKSLKEGVGSSAEMNALLICLLKDAGYEAYPVVMSLRSNGRVFINQPSMKQLNYFVTGVKVNNKPMYMDASSKYGSLNGLPIDCMVENARAIHKDKPSEWVNLQNLKKNMTVNTVNAKFNEEGIITGNMKSLKVGVPCVNFCLNIEEENDIEEYKQKLASRRNLSIIEYQVEGNKQTAASTREAYTFDNSNIALGDDHVYINSLIFPFVEENPFKSETRNLPVEFPYPYEHTQSVVIDIPAGYAVEELPKPEKIVLNDNDISYVFLIKHDENSIQISQKVILNRIIYGVPDYQNVRDFWAAIANKNAEQIVLKKL